MFAPALTLFSDFNSHAHVERDNYVKWQYDFNGNFNSHAHVERDVRYFTTYLLHCYFNSHAHVERDVRDYGNLWQGYISTHTLTWSVTGFSSKVCLDHMDFNSHAHVERDTDPNSGTCSYGYFNSHAHVERDVKTVQFLTLFCISTHTLTWSVTPFPLPLRPLYPISTHTLTWSVTIL